MAVIEAEEPRGSRNIASALAERTSIRFAGVDLETPLAA